MLCVLIKVLSHANVKKKTNVLGFKISHFYWSFSSDIIAVKGLKPFFVVVEMIIIMIIITKT